MPARDCQRQYPLYFSLDRRGQEPLSSDSRSLETTINVEGTSVTDFSAPPPSSPPVYYDSIVEPQSPSDPPTPTRSRAPPTGTTDQTPTSPEPFHLPVPRTPATARSRQTSGSPEPHDYTSEYYTAAWGSPYARELSPSLLSRSARTAVSEQAFSDDFAQSSPGPSFSLEHLIPSRFSEIPVPPTPQSLLELPSTGLTDEDIDHTPRSRTKRWVQLPQRQPSGKSQWWSEDSARSNSDRGNGQSRETSVSGVSSGGKPARSHHKAREENRTLDQQSFWNILREKRSGDMDGMYSSRWAATPPVPEEPSAEAQSVRVPGPLNEKSLPATPAAGRDFPVENANGTIIGGAEKEESANPTIEVSKEVLDAKAPGAYSADFAQTPLEPARLEPPRLRKRVSWRGKACVISIPQLDYDAFGLIQPMSADEIQQRVKHFEDAGYNTRGFDVGDDTSASAGPVHVRPIFPSENDVQMEAKEKGRHRVQLPNSKLWANYMDQLTEAKLAALGVSLGFDEPTPNPAPDMSRQSSGQYPPLPFTPPLPPGSGASMGRPGMIRGHSHTMSMATPISPLNGPFGHMHRHSTFHGGFPGMVLPQRQSQEPQRQPSLPGLQTFSPQPPFNQNQMGRVASPAQLAALRTEFGGMRGPGSPLSNHMIPQSPQDYSRGLMEDQRRRQHGYSQSVQFPPMQNMQPPFLSQQQQRPSFGPTPLLPELPEDEDEEELSDPQPYRPPQKRVSINEEIAVPTPRGHRHNISEGLEREVMEAEQRRVPESFQKSGAFGRQDQPLVAANGTYQLQQPMASQEAPKPANERAPLSGDLGQGPRGHKKSASRFNVEAPAFTFNPGASFQPGANSFSIDGNGPESTVAGKTGHTRQQSSGNFNVAAPVFQPGASLSNLPKSDFSFSSNGPTFSDRTPVAGASTIDQSSSDEKTRIFGKVEIPDIIKPAKKSQAIQIKKPSEDLPLLGTDVEDEEGRIGRSDDRQKKQRVGGGDDGDSVPLFAEPTPIPALPTETPQVPGAPAPTKSHAKVDSEAVKTVQDLSVKVQASADILDDDEGKENVPPVPTTKPAFRPGHKSASSLSALAKPFVFQTASTTEAQSRSPEKPGHDRFASISELEEGEIREDEPAKASSVRRLASLDQHSSERDTTPSLSEPLMPYQFPNGQGLREETPAIEPTFDEIDAIMQQMNEPEPQTDAKPVRSISPLPSPDFRPQDAVSYLPGWPRSDAPSPSPKRQPLLNLAHPGDSSFTVHDRTSSGEQPGLNGWPPVQRLNKSEEVPASDWSDMLSSPEEDKLQQRSMFFDSHIDTVIGRVVERRLQPLEDSLRAIQSTVNKRARSNEPMMKLRSSSNIDSDADDEDELSEAQRQRPISRGKDQKLSQIKSIVLEALREQSPRRSQSSYDISDLHSALADMKVSFARAASASLELDDIRAVVEDVVARQSQALAHTQEEEESLPGHRRQLSELEGRLNETLAGALEEANHRHQVEEREAETRRMLRLAEEELQLLRESNRDDDSRVQALEHERRDLLTRLDDAEEARDTAQEQFKNYEAENEAMQATLEEYRMSSTQWRHEIDDGKVDREQLESTIAGLERQVEAVQKSGRREREELESTIEVLERQFEESQDASSGMRRRLEKLHSDMATAAGQLVSEKAGWKSREDEFRARCEVLESQCAAQAIEKAQLEEEVRALRVVAAEAQDAKLITNHLQISETSLEETVQKLQSDLTDSQALSARFEREFHDARESGRAEVQRTRISMESEIEAANRQVNITRADLESELVRIRNDLDNVRMEADTAKERHALMLEEEADARRDALRKVNHSNSVALDDARQKYEAAAKELAAQHSRVLHHAVEDKDRSEYFLNERLSLADAKLQHFQDRVLHLEERLEVTKTAAQAAAMSAQAKAAPVVAHRSLPAAPEKVSAQALRESILVLQEQLQDRETRIEQLQHQAKHEGPEKIKERDTEIAWLRELLAVRNDELTELVNTLSRPTFDRDNVRDAAIRIRANLQMEQQEKERITQGATLPGQAIASLSSFATPKASQLMSGFNKWRSSMESNSLKARTSARDSRSYTPSRPAATDRPRAPPHMSSGLMTPPASNVRSSPGPEPTALLPPPQLSRPTSRQQHEVQLVDKTYPEDVQPEEHTEMPSTPPGTLFRENSYDQDAEDTQARMSSFGEGDQRDEDLDIADDQPPAFRSLEEEMEPAGETPDEQDGVVEL